MSPKLLQICKTKVKSTQSRLNEIIECGGIFKNVLQCQQSYCRRPKGVQAGTPVRFEKIIEHHAGISRKRWLKSTEVMELLNISLGSKLQGQRYLAIY